MIALSGAAENRDLSCFTTIQELTQSSFCSSTTSTKARVFDWQVVGEPIDHNKDADDLEKQKQIQIILHFLILIPAFAFHPKEI